MLKEKKRTKTAAVIVLLLAPPVAYAVYMLALFILDSFQGDGLILHWYEFESRRRLAVQLLSDGRQALPLFYAAAVGLWMEFYLLARYSQGVVLAVISTGVLAGFAIATVSMGMTWGSIAPAVVSGLLLSLMVAWTAPRAVRR
jgi:hypothetical protein